MKEKLKIFFIKPRIRGALKGLSVFAENQKEALEVAEVSLKDYEIKEGSSFEKELNFVTNKKAKERDFTLTFRRVARLLRAKISIEEAIGSQRKSMKNIFSKYICFKISRDLRNGTPLSEAFSKYPETFSNGLIAMLRSAEKSGELELVFENIGSMERNKHIMIKKFFGQMIYPMITIATCFIVVIGFSVFFLPKLKELYSNCNAELPLTTRLMLEVVGFLRTNPIAWCLSLVALMLFFSKKRVILASNFFQRGLYSLPGIGSFLWKKDFILVIQHLSMLLVAKISVREAIENASDVTKNNAIRSIFKKMSNELKNGKSISELFKKYTPMFRTDGLELRNIIEIGEKTGELESLLKLYSNESMEELKLDLDNFGNLVKPVLTIVLSLFVVLVIATIGLPIFNLTYEMSRGLHL